jgi:hypothetical protein
MLLLMDAADECHAVGGGYLFRFTRASAALRLVAGLFDANPELRFQMTIDEMGICWLNVRSSNEMVMRRAPARARRERSGFPVVA